MKYKLFESYANVEGDVYLGCPACDWTWYYPKGTTLAILIDMSKYHIKDPQYSDRHK